jgi:hypothetical protein
MYRTYFLEMFITSGTYNDVCFVYFFCYDEGNIFEKYVCLLCHHTSGIATIHTLHVVLV